LPELHLLIDSLLQSLTDAGVIGAVAELAGIESEVVPQPVNVEFVAGRNVDELLEQRFQLIPEAGGSRGASLLVSPAKDLRMPSERAAQVDDFLREIALDAGLTGMEQALIDHHNLEARRRQG
jgi:hypothetical protein